MNNPINTKNKRKDLVYKYGAEIPPFWADQEIREIVHYSCTGLNIAQEMADVLETAAHIIDCATPNCPIKEEEVEAVRNADRIINKWDKWRDINRIRDYDD